jgi:hypothetical protein
MYCSGCGQAMEAWAGSLPQVRPPPSPPGSPGSRIAVPTGKLCRQNPGPQHLLVRLCGPVAFARPRRADLCQGILVRRLRPLDVTWATCRPCGLAPACIQFDLDDACAARRAGHRCRLGADGAHPMGPPWSPLSRPYSACSSSPSEPPSASGPWSCCSAIETPHSTTSSREFRSRSLAPALTLSAPPLRPERVKRVEGSASCKFGAWVGQ